MPRTAVSNQHDPDDGNCLKSDFLRVSVLGKLLGSPFNTPPAAYRTRYK
jgi:hypothetical protein